jgi:hypothetical protein
MEKYCRNHVQGFSPCYDFKPVDHTYKKEDADLLVDAGRATVDGDEFQLDKDMVGGRFIYPALPGEKRLPTNPLLFLVMRSCTNVQVRCESIVPY